jgi:glycogen debranching enzyme
MLMEKEHLLKICKDVLDLNKNGKHTMPAPNLYPHQWLWDSCFVAIGLSNYDAARARDELLEIVKGQWSNGMIPHMIFDQSKKYATDRRVWRSYVSHYSPDIPTSGITQPPILAEAVYRVAKKLPRADAQKFLQKVVPHLVRHHTWLMTERDPHDEGLVLQIHPWETGLDNTPPWMNQLHEHSKPWWIWTIEKLKLDAFVNLLRRDTQHVAPGQRITNVEALMVFDMISRFRRKNYDITCILHRSLFCIEDIGFNSILARNNQILIDIAKLARHKLPEDLIAKIDKQKFALQSCWDEESSTFYSRDFITHDAIKQQTVSSLLAIYSGVISKEQAKCIVANLQDFNKFATNHPVPSVPINDPQYSEQRYWQGPTWLNTNWLLIDGLRQYGYEDLANSLRDSSINLVNIHGPYEYFSALSGAPLGAKDFSWTAALTIDLLAR